MALLGRRAENRDVQIGTVLAFLLVWVFFSSAYIQDMQQKHTRFCLEKFWVLALSMFLLH